MPSIPFFTVDHILLLALFAAATSWTPGPNNVMLANSGATFGLGRTAPHILGVALGFGAMAFAVSYALGEVFEASPALQAGVKYAGAALMLYLAWRVATASGGLSSGGSAGEGRPFSFVEAAAFQWINPKAWTMATGVSAAYVFGDAPLAEAVGVGVVFALVGLTSATGWAAFGAALRRFLADGGRLRVFNIAMGVLVALSVVLLFVD